MNLWFRYTRHSTLIEEITQIGPARLPVPGTVPQVTKDICKINTDDDNMYALKTYGIKIIFKCEPNTKNC